MTVNIHIEYPRPLTILVIVAMIGAFILSEGSVSSFNMGGPGARYYASLTQEAETDIRKLRIEQDILSRREDVLRFELRVLEEEALRYGSAKVDEFNLARQRLNALLTDRAHAEREILASFRQIWSIQGRATEFANAVSGSTRAKINWPVEPRYGVSALFNDQEYHQRFGLPHTGVDIPIEQGSIVRAAYDGTVVDVADNGFGFNAVVIRHPDGFVTLYGHVNRFLVQQGQVVKEGDPIALSGGRPGTLGAGALTTGPHVHFEVITNGTNQDPLAYLPIRSSVAILN
jgi:murein DD-endopeptidase MepM/ murein hydrolase activator NlpD